MPAKARWTQRIDVRLTEEQYEALARLAERNGLSLSAQARMILRRQIEKEEQQ